MRGFARDRDRRCRERWFARGGEVGCESERREAGHCNRCRLETRARPTGSQKPPARFDPASGRSSFSPGAPPRGPRVHAECTHFTAVFLLAGLRAGAKHSRPAPPAARTRGGRLGLRTIPVPDDDAGGPEPNTVLPVGRRLRRAQTAAVLPAIFRFSSTKGVFVHGRVHAGGFREDRKDGARRRHGGPPVGDGDPPRGGLVTFVSLGPSGARSVVSFEPNAICRRPRRDLLRSSRTPSSRRKTRRAIAAESREVQREVDDGVFTLATFPLAPPRAYPDGVCAGLGQTGLFENPA